MFSIKSSLADCISCELFSENSCILETNCKSFDEVEVIFISGNPDDEEVKKEIPLTNQTFRKYFKKYHLDNSKYLLTNVVLCKTENPSKELIDKCKVNCFDMIEQCNPKLIVILGSLAGNAFDILDESGITSLRGNIFKWNDIDTLLTLHPNYINMHREDEPKFEEDIRKVAEIMGTKTSEKSNVKTSIGKKEVFYYKIPDKYYTSDYRLIDVQFLNKTNEVLYMFRDKDNKKVYHKENDTYVCYQAPKGIDTRLILEYDKLNQIKLPYKQRTTLNSKITYEGDVNIAVKHCQDYYLQKTADDTHISLNPLFLDIETYSKNREYSTVDDANDAITIIGYWYDGVHKTYVVDPKAVGIETALDEIDLKENEKVIMFKSEREMITKCLMDIKKIDPDCVSGWFADEFDLPYIVNRCKKIGVNVELLSPFNEVEIDYHRHSVKIAGMVVTDLLFLYKMFTQNKEESYKLDFIANLKLGEGKHGSGSEFSEMFRENPANAIKYNMQDVRLLPMLNDKMKHIDLQNKIRETCKTNFAGAKGSMGQLDSLIVSFLKEKGFSSKNANIEGKESKFEGAYVKEPRTGVHDYIVDFDFTSLYPSLILTYNIGVNTFVMKFEDFTLGYDLAYNKNNLPNEMKVIIDPLYTKREVMITKDELLNKIKDSNLICTVNGCFFENHEKELSVYSQILEDRLKSRKEYKDKMFEAEKAGDKDKKELYDVRQNAEKIIGNSLYGILGNNAFRFYNIDCARSITLSGQEALKTTILESDAYVDFLKTGKHSKPDTLKKSEMYSEEFNPDVKHLVTGDTDSVFLCLDKLLKKEKSEDDKVIDVLKYCDEIKDYLNNTVIHNVVAKHSTFLDKNRLYLKNELVIKRGLFLAKKRYSNHIIFNEGVKVDKIKSMGLETKRSDFPSMSKIKLQELLELILKSTEVRFPVLLKFVKGVESSFTKIIKERNKMIAKPVSFGKALKDYKVQSQGIRGMLAWNSLEYNTFVQGSRGYLFKISGIDLEKAPKEVVDKYNKEFMSNGKKLDVITLPDTEETLPPYYIINEKDMLKFAWIDRYNLMLEPLVPRTQLLKF